MRIGVFFASETGNTKNHAFDIVNCFFEHGFNVDDPKDIANLDLEMFQEYDLMVFGSPTWNIGELQADLGDIIEDLSQINLSGKLVAIYGCGDQEGYPDTYQDAIGILAKRLTEAGAFLIGKTPIQGHNFISSQAQVGKEFLGLALDNHNQADMSQDRIHHWVKQLVTEIKIKSTIGEKNVS